MATAKTKQSLAALIHATLYSLPFLLFRPSWLALFVIWSTHFFIDRYRLARMVVWLKNLMSPTLHTWEECQGTGYPKDAAAWLAVWLLIIADNIMHVTINGLALKYL